MGAIDVSEVTFTLPDGRVLLDRASFRIGDRDHVALVGSGDSNRAHSDLAAARVYGEA